jgi:hypothetical protein
MLLEKMGGTVQGRRHTWDIRVESVPPDNPEQIELSQTYAYIATDENGKAHTDHLKVKDSEGDRPIYDYMSFFKKSAENDFGEGT